MFENLSERLERSFKILKGQGKITELNVAETLKEVRRSLLDADVNYKISKDFTNRVTEKPLLVACDDYRPAAIEQLKVLGEQIQVPEYSDETTKDPVRIALDAIKQAKAKGYDVVIVDTAGRLAIDEQMMNEIAAIKEAIHPNETLFVVDAMTGQDAVNTAREFN